MNHKTITVISLLIISILLSACGDDSSKQSKQPPSDSGSDDDIGIIEPYLKEPELEVHRNGERKIGLYFESNGQGHFQDCKSGKEYTVDINQDKSLLHSTYAELSHHDGQKLMVELIGEIKTIKDKGETLQPQTLVGVIHKHRCD